MIARADMLDAGRPLGRFGTMVGRSPAMQQVYQQIARVASTSLGVLVVGESGVGKELVAQALHALGPRSERAWLPVHCGAIAPSLIESELFGHERGAFTGAERVHQGCFERCDGGTLFLDEITEMPLELQIKLLRVLESREILRVGGSRAIPVDVRVVAATNRDPRAAVAEGILRGDLYYRLAVFPLRVPPLRERRGDVPLLARHFLDRLNEEHGTRKTWTLAALDRLETFRLSGNVRELRNLVSRAYVLCEEVLTAEVLGECGEESAGEVAAADEAGSGVLTLPVGTSLAHAEQLLIEATLARFGGDKPKAAGVLGISLKTLYTRLKLYAAARRAASETPMPRAAPVTRT